MNFQSLLLALSLFFASQENSEPAWKTSTVLFYNLHFRDVTDERLQQIQKLLTDFDQRFSKRVSLSRWDQSQSKIDVWLFPRGHLQCTTGHASLSNNWQNTEKEKGWLCQGKLEIACPAAFDGKELSTSTHPKDANYFDKLLVHEIAPIYLDYFCKAAGNSFWNSPDWFVQGFEEYMAVMHSTSYWANVGKNSYLEFLKQNTNCIDVDFFFSVKDEYNGGYLMLKFVADEYGEDALFQILKTKGDSLGQRFRLALKTEAEPFFEKFKKWKAVQLR